MKGNFMDMDLVSIIRGHRSKSKFRKASSEEITLTEKSVPRYSEFPDLLFDEILIEFKLQRVEILVLIYIYRKIWNPNNAYSKYGIGPMLSHQDLSKVLKIDLDELQKAIRKLESLGLIETIRVGQYFIRKYFTEKNDINFNQNYDDF